MGAQPGPVATADAYDRIGRGYRDHRRPDPRIAARIEAALGGARTVVNVGAGAGSYEPTGARVVAVEPSELMLAQRRGGSAAAIRAVAEALPFPDASFDAALAVLTVHHWSNPGRGLAELRRVAVRVVVLTGRSEQVNRLWLTSDYFPAMARLRTRYLQPERIAALLGGDVRIEAVLVPRDCVDGFAESYWGRPERCLDPQVRSAASAFSLLTPEETEPGLRRLRADLASGEWDRRYGHLRELPELDTGHRLVVATAGC